LEVNALRICLDDQVSQGYVLGHDLMLQLPHVYDRGFELGAGAVLAANRLSG